MFQNCTNGWKRSNLKKILESGQKKILSFFKLLVVCSVVYIGKCKLSLFHNYPQDISKKFLVAVLFYNFYSQNKKKDPNYLYFRIMFVVFYFTFMVEGEETEEWSNESHVYGSLFVCSIWNPLFAYRYMKKLDYIKHVIHGPLYVSRCTDTNEISTPGW